MDSKYIKAVLFHYFRFQKQAHYIATECGPYNSDMLVCYKDQLVEIEIKTSIADFKNDFKKPKHEYYLKNKADKSMMENVWLKDSNGKNVIEGGRYVKVGERVQNYYARAKPNSFLFVVPEALVDKVASILVTNYPHYGLLSVSGNNTFRDSGVRTVIRPKKLHSEPASGIIKETIVARMASEIANLRLKEQKEINGKAGLNEDQKNDNQPTEDVEGS